MYRADNTSFLISKKFKLVFSLADEFKFKKNENQPNEERVSSGRGWLEYVSKDMAYIKTLLKQANTELKKRNIKSIRKANNDGRIKIPWHDFTTGKVAISFALLKDSAIIVLDFKHP